MVKKVRRPRVKIVNADIVRTRCGLLTFAACSVRRKRNRMVKAMVKPPFVSVVIAKSHWFLMSDVKKVLVEKL